MVSSPEETGLLPPGFLAEREVEPVGRWFLAQWDRINSTRTISSNIHDDSSSDEEDGDEDEIFEDDLEYLRSLDPKETKDQDHYRVLGITNLRIRATDDQIKRAHRQKVLRHHPDKRKAAGEDIKVDDDYFTCITKAFEILGNPVKRRSFDSVDPLFDDDIPDALKKEKQGDFLNVFTSVFEMNSRWSIKTPVPKLGDNNASRKDVEDFYGFWYDFESWREYSYLDEEDKEKASDKWERKEIERINKAQRIEKKKDECKRIRKLVDNAYNSDPRIARFRKADFDEKAAKKKAKADAIKAKKDEEERLRKEEEEKAAKEREKVEQAEKLKQEASKKEKEAHKKLLRNERKKLRTFTKEKGFFASDEDERIHHMTEVEKMCDVYTLEQLTELNNKLETSEDPKNDFLKELRKMSSRMSEERALVTEQSKASGSATSSDKSNKGAAKEWSSDELHLLIKAVNLFPAGTAQRWDVVAEFINQHTKTQNIKRNAKETLAKAKEMQSGNFAMNTLKEEVNKLAYENLEKQKKRELQNESEASIRTETPAEALGFNNTPWAPEEQKLLEQALKTYPSTTPERWDRIAECLPGRSKKDCMKRYKELAELIRAKKAAQAAAKKS